MINPAVYFQDVSITELFPESKSSNGSLAYNCSCCRKSFVRKTTLVKHLKLDVYKDKFKAKKNCCKKKADEKLKKFDDSNFSGTNSPNSPNSGTDENDTEGTSLVKSEPIEEFEEAKSVDDESAFAMDMI